MVTSREIISEAQRRYRLGLIDDDEFIRVVDQVTLVGGAEALLRIMKRRRKPTDDPNAIEAEFTILGEDADIPIR